MNRNLEIPNSVYCICSKIMDTFIRCTALHAALGTHQELPTMWEHLFPTGGAPVRCFTRVGTSPTDRFCDGSNDGEFNTVSIEDCCRSPNGQFFVDPAGIEGCTPCIGM